MKKVKTSDRLKQIMKERNLKQVDIINMSKPHQEKLGITMSKSHLSQYVNDKSNPDNYKLHLLALTLNVGEAWLMGYEDAEKERQTENDVDIVMKVKSITSSLEKSRQQNVLAYAKHQLTIQEETNGKVISLNTYKNNTTKEVNVNGYASAGTGETLLDEVVFTVEVKGYTPPHDLALQVNGDSMQPLFEDKEIIFIEKTNDINSGQIGVFIIDGEAYVKKVFIEEERIRLVSLNKKYEDLYFYNNEGIELVGKVIL